LQLPVEEAIKHVLYAHRPGWSEQVKPGDIIVAGKNFGIGSSRPVPMLLRRLGITCVIADEINSLFTRNCVNYALPVLEIAGVSDIFLEGDTATIYFTEGKVQNDRTGELVHGEAWPPFVLDIIKAGGLVESLRKQGYVA
jgi:3-isopropylmalate/(R)-2-methylmalate dehydratase small subunit